MNITGSNNPLNRLWKGVSGLSSSEKAILDAICLAICADGVIDEDEVTYAIHFLSSFLDLHVEDATDFVDASFERIHNTDINDAVAHITATLQDPQEREVAFTCAAIAQLTDGVITVDEEGFLVLLGQSFGYTPDTIQTLVDQAQAHAEDSFNT